MKVYQLITKIHLKKKFENNDEALEELSDILIEKDLKIIEEYFINKKSMSDIARMLGYSRQYIFQRINSIAEKIYKIDHIK